MEGKLSANSSEVLDGFYASLDLQGAMQVNHQQNLHSHQSFIEHPQDDEDNFSFEVLNVEQRNEPVTFPARNNKGKKLKNFASAGEKENVSEGFDGHNESSEKKIFPPSKRVIWTDRLIKLLITAASYVVDGGTLTDPIGARRIGFLLVPNKDRWELISKVLVERGFQVLPFQCEDKFNELTRKYKRLNDILGRGTSCDVIDKPALLDSMNIPVGAKEEVQKILSTKQLFYQEMCSFHNRNRVYLPHDLDLKRALQVALKGKKHVEPHGESSYNPVDSDEEDEDTESDDCIKVDSAEMETSVFPGFYGKRKKQWEENEVGASGYSKRMGSHPPNNNPSANQWMMSRALQLIEEKLYIHEQMMVLEEYRYHWNKLMRQEDRKLDKMRLENERMKLANARLEAEIKRRKLSANFK